MKQNYKLLQGAKVDPTGKTTGFRIPVIAGTLISYFLILCFASCADNIDSKFPKDYEGLPYKDNVAGEIIQTIPGKIECAYYDLGGQGVAYNDREEKNLGSGEYNYQDGHCDGAGEYICRFRENEGVDISFTKSFLDFTENNIVTPPERQLFIGWTAPDEWCNYTVVAEKPGTYAVDFLYSGEGSTFALSINGTEAFNVSLPSVTGNYHHWNCATDLARVTFASKGKHLLKIYNYANVNAASLTFRTVD